MVREDVLAVASSGSRLSRHAVAGELFDAVDAAAARRSPPSIAMMSTGPMAVGYSRRTSFAPLPMRSICSAVTCRWSSTPSLMRPGSRRGRTIRPNRCAATSLPARRSGFVGRRADHLLRHFSINVVIGVVGVMSPACAHGGHPVERLVWPSSEKISRLLSALMSSTRLASGRGGVQSSGIFGRAVSNNNSHEALPYHARRRTYGHTYSRRRKAT